MHKLNSELFDYLFYNFQIFVDDDIGDIFKLRFGFPASTTSAKWNLKSLKLWQPKTGDTFRSPCNLEITASPYVDCWREVYVAWPDFPVLKELTYVVQVYTSNNSGSMNCGVDVILYGDRGNSGRRTLKKYLGNKKKFRAGQMDQFELQVIELGRVLKVHVFNDLKSPNRRWLLDKMVVKPKDNDDKEWEFKCRRYFDPSKGDGQTDRLLELGKDAHYESEDDAGSGDSESLKNVFRNEFKSGKNRELPPPPLSPVRPVMQKGEDVPDDLWEIWWENRKIQQSYPKVGVIFVMVGQYGESHSIPMVVDLKAGISTARKIVLRQDLIGDLDKIRMRFSEQASAGMKWEVAKIHLKHLATGEVTTFSFERPVLQKSHGDSTVEASSNGLIPNRSYTCELYSGDRPGFLEEETPHVYVMIRGKRGDTGKRWIDPERGSIIWRKNSVASFEIQCVDLGDITGIKFGHDRRGKDASYYLEKIVIKPNHLSDVRYVFQFDKV